MEQKHLDKVPHQEGYYLTNILTGEYNEGDTNVAYNNQILLFTRPPELKHKTNKGAPQKVVAKPRKQSQILRTLQSNSQNETNTFASEKRNTKRTRISEIQKYISIIYFTEPTKENCYNSTKTQSYHDASNLIHNENSSILFFIPPSTNTLQSFPNNNQPLYNPYIQRLLTHSSDSLPTDLQSHESLNMLNSPFFYDNSHNLPNF
ncbi:hypothetical protein C1646_769960 [Rhizophagus diaphanus]|nr:hypothetical protein C1646_769960 [Rhizophagus diaphanus] [Rhizophagus sp. MUCL 43196]